MQQNLAVLLIQPQLLLQETATPGLYVLWPLLGADRHMEVVGEGEQEGLGCQAAERALNVEEVGGASADEGAVVGDVREQPATIRRAAQGLLINI